MLLYCFACVFNVALDLITTYMVAYRVMSLGTLQFRLTSGAVLRSKSGLEADPKCPNDSTVCEALGEAFRLRAAKGSVSELLEP